MLSAIAHLLLRAGGWRIQNDFPAVDKAVLTAAPHTSNWDGIWAMIFLVATRLDVHFFAKQSLFWFPLGNILRALGGIPLDRTRAGGAVQQAVDMFGSRQRLIFGLAPEGTRKYRDHWRSGFYRIAERAGVPIVPGYFDYTRRRIGFGPVYALTGDRDADLAFLRAFYEKEGDALHPELEGPVRLDS